MALLLDTDTVPRRERRDVVRAAMSSTVVPSRVDVEPRDDAVRARIEAWPLGTVASLVHIESSGHRMTRTARHLRGGAEERISLAVQLRGPSTFTHRDLPPLQLGELQLVDLTSPFELTAGPGNAAQALYIDNAQLGLPVDVVRDAAPRLRGSPFYELTRAHLEHLRTAADRVDGRGSGALLGTATVAMVRALIATAAGAADHRHAVAESMMLRITAYMRTHLGEADLDPERVAAEHHISVRYLHRLFAQEDLSVRRWLMRERLDAAGHLLVADAHRGDSIAAIGRRCGFADPGHFARRFRAAYGMSPREWRLGTAADPVQLAGSAP